MAKLTLQSYQLAPVLRQGSGRGRRLSLGPCPFLTPVPEFSVNHTAWLALEPHSRLLTKDGHTIICPWSLAVYGVCLHVYTHACIHERVCCCIWKIGSNLYNDTEALSHRFRSTVVTLNITPFSQRIIKRRCENGQFPMLSPS